MTTSIKRIPQPVPPVVRFNNAYGKMEAALAELDAIKLSELPRNSPYREPLKAARAACNEALRHAGTAMRVPPTAPVKSKPRRRAARPAAASTSVQRKAS